VKFPGFQKNVLIILGIDLLLLAGALYASYMIRFEFDIPSGFFIRFKLLLPAALGIKFIVFNFFDLYRGMWRYTGLSDLLNIIKASSVSTLIIISIVLFSSRFVGFSRSIFIIDLCLTILLISGLRLSVRFYFENADQSLREAAGSLFRLFKKPAAGGKNLIIIGAGDGGEKIFREIRNNAQLGYSVVGFLDDNPIKIGKKIHSLPVLGPIRDLSIAAQKVRADETLIAIPSASSDQMRNIVELCKESGVTFKTIPGYGELIDGRVTVNSIREVAYRDLLGREEIRLDKEKIGAYLKGETVLITGAGGSIGSELCRQVCRFAPGRILLYERAESPLYEIELELKRTFPEVDVIPILADIQDPAQLKAVFDTHCPQTVFHAAAYKHVPMLELQPWKAVENNIQGTLNLLAAAEQHNIERFVFVSTDKAVRPTNVMGASKRVAEMLVQNRHTGPDVRTRFMIVRFGNVIGSVGSVIPLFKKQIAEGGPVTVTHPEVTRFFMMIHEACQLILQAGALGNGGNGVEIYVLDMGTPIKIIDMARDLIRFSGFVPDEEMKIEVVGLRPGEKLYEELMSEDEGIVPTSHDKIMVLRGADPNPENFNNRVQDLLATAKTQDGGNLVRKLREIVHEYEPQGW